MILLDQNKNKIYAQKTKSPKFSSHGGRTWDHGHIKIDDHTVEAYLDTTWGEYIYFQLQNSDQWYKLKMISDSIDDLKRGYSYNVDPFATEPQKLTTK